MTYTSVDLLGIGFGPAGISFAAAIEDHIEATGTSPVGSFRFLEAGSDCRWQGELLFRHADINHSALRDLVTPRNPRSFYSFANYLKKKGRLYSFGLTGRPVNRIEWSDYVAWAGELLAGNTSFGTAVTALTPSAEVDGKWTRIRARTSTGEEIEAGRLVLSTGARPNIPEIYRPHLGARVFHTGEFATRVNAIADPSTVRRVAVIGSGMSAGEIALDFRTRFPESDVHCVHRSHGFRLNDLSNFSSEVYSPAETDYVHGLPREARKAILAESWQTNYAGLDADGSSELYNTMYLDEVEGRPRIFMEKRTHVTAVDVEGQNVVLSLRDPHTGEGKSLSFDLVVIATGFRVDPMAGPLGDLAEHIELDADGMPVVSRAYKVATKPSMGAEIYLNGQCEHSHGISDAQSFSLLADRSGWILEDMMAPEIRAAPAVRQPAEVG
ncbi:L-lysine 6-monooxygenase [Roseovarius sp. A21]|uniref:L-lysine 6-monooxygenase n=1 Tax=Roseovarius bejariae TaxID=2576383 RepID=A0A844CRA1_9RHOB|nr:SidA/IucD/PvdA family monooxygenase [Roseovarius bejariae]MRU17092.1 L-lysine 6-monooxygenase [Roseovarius bejariae]